MFLNRDFCMRKLLSMEVTFFPEKKKKKKKKVEIASMHETNIK